jgi:hypothetical protein
LFKVTVQVEVAPDNTLDGEQVTVTGTVGAIRLSEKLAVAPLRLAVTNAVPLTVTADAEAVKVAVEAPAATVTAAGVVTKVLLSARATAIPPVGASDFKTTVQIALPLPVIEDGVQLNEEGATGTATGSETTPPVADVVMLSPASEAEFGFET